MELLGFNKTNGSSPALQDRLLPESPRFCEQWEVSPLLPNSLPVSKCSINSAPKMFFISMLHKMLTRPQKGVGSGIVRRQTEWCSRVSGKEGFREEGMLELTLGS